MYFIEQEINKNKKAWLKVYHETLNIYESLKIHFMDEIMMKLGWELEEIVDLNSMAKG